MKFLIPIRCINIRFINLGRSYPLATLLLPPYYPLTIPLLSPYQESGFLLSFCMMIHFNLYYFA